MIKQHKRQKHLLVKLCLCLMLVGVLCFGTLLGVVVAGGYDDVEGEPGVMIIPGCQVMEWGPSIMPQDRLNEALEYLQEHPEVLVVVSGGQGDNEPTTEARAMADYLVARGVEADAILLEDQSRNTSQNLHYSMVLLSQEHADLSGGVIVVSNGFHLTRARMLAERAGFEQVHTLAAPSSHIPSRLHMYLREPLALVKSFVFDQ